MTILDIHFSATIVLFYSHQDTEELLECSNCLYAMQRSQSLPPRLRSLLLLGPANLQFEMLSNNINIVLNTAFTAHTISFCGFDKEADTTVTQLCLY